MPFCFLPFESKASFLRLLPPCPKSMRSMLIGQVVSTKNIYSVTAFTSFKKCVKMGHHENLKLPMGELPPVGDDVLSTGR